MGNNQSVPSSFLKLNIVSENDNISSSNIINDGFVSEDYLAEIIHQIMAKDEVLAIIRRSVGEPLRKKSKQVRKRKIRCTPETLQQSVWGQLMLAIQEEIAEKGSLPQSDLQKTFGLRFRVVQRYCEGMCRRGCIRWYW